MISTPNLLLLSQIVTDATIRSLINLLQHENIGFPTLDSAIIELLENVKKHNARLRFNIPSQEDISIGRHKSERLIKVSDAENIEIIGLFNDLYPPLLKEITKPPLLLHCKGDTSILNTATVAIIGTREPSPHVIEMGPRLAKHVVEADLTVVSGLAVGCDTIGHKASVDAGKPTIAVLAGGLHSIYPKENRPLSDGILNKGGLLISELPFGQDPQRNTFVDRDRIQSGLSYGVVVLETGVKGGTLHTVKFANEQKRLVGCMYSQSSTPYESHEKFQGNKLLVSKGQAIRLDKKEQLLEFIQNIKERSAGTSGAPLQNKTELPHHGTQGTGEGNNLLGQLSFFK